MTKQNKKTILVIGSKGHQLANKCIDWGEVVYIGDFDSIIVNVTTLNTHKLQLIRTKSPHYFNDLRKQIVDAQNSNKGLDIICIMDRYCLAQGLSEYSDAKEKIKWSNYSWSPIIPLLEVAPEGKKIDRSSSEINKDYLRLINGWDLLYDSHINNTRYIDADEQSGIYFKGHFHSLLKNNIGRSIAFQIQWKIHKHFDSNILIDSNKPIVFLPRVPNLKKGIDVLLGELREDLEIVAPDWVNDIRLPNEEQIVENIQALEIEIESIKKAKKEKEGEQEELNQYKKLLYLTGAPLEDIVEKSFLLLGIKLTSLEVKNKEDRVYKEEDVEIPIEIKGKNSGLNEADINQLTSRFVNKPESNKYKTRGIFVLNHFREIKPEHRDEAFHHNIVEKAKPWQVCLITTETIFELVEKKLSGEKIENLREDVLNTVGVFELKD